MRRIILFTVIFLILYFLSPLKALPEVKKRWELDFTNDPPKVFTYTTPGGKKINYWYMIYTITNDTRDNIRLGIDISIKADTGEYYQDMFFPIVEDGMIALEEKLVGLGIGIQKERIKELKKELKYINCKELRDKNEIKAGETIKCIAAFKEVNRRANEIEVMIGGLVDVIKRRFDPPPMREGTVEDRLLYEYECKIWKIIYHLPGDEFYDPNKPIREIKKDWVIRNYGPIGSKKTLEVLIESLSEENPLLRWIGWWLLKKLTGNEFKYNPAKSPDENKKSIDRWHEWWSRNKEYLEYNLNLNMFEVKKPEE